MDAPESRGQPGGLDRRRAHFRSALLAGYAYADLPARLRRLAVRVVVHAVVLTAAVSRIPLALGGAGEAPGTPPTLWLLSTLRLDVRIIGPRSYRRLMS